MSCCRDVFGEELPPLLVENLSENGLVSDAKVSCTNQLWREERKGEKERVFCKALCGFLEFFCEAGGGRIHWGRREGKNGKTFNIQHAL